MVKPWDTATIGDFLDFKNGLNKGKEFFGYGTPIVNYTDVYRKRGLTQYSLAQNLGRSTRYLNNLEHDRNEPRFTTILLLADAIGMDPGELVNAAAALSWAALTEEEGALGEMEEG